MAQMGVLEVWHPEIEDFIKAKLTAGRFTKFNLSIGIVNGFMEAVINDLDWNLIFPDVTNTAYKTEWAGDIEDWISKGYPVKVYKTVKARYLWDLIMKSTYERNDPGALFFDLFNKLNPLAYAERILVTNPCASKTILAQVKNHVYAGNSLRFSYYNIISNDRYER